jgi:hypothetical protein
MQHTRFLLMRPILHIGWSLEALLYVAFVGRVIVMLYNGHEEKSDNSSAKEGDFVMM